MKFSLIILIFTAVLFIGCKVTGSSGVKTLSGSILVSTTDVKVGAFSDDYWFMEDPFGDEEDEVGSEFSDETTFTPIATGTISGSTYSITLPDDVTAMGDLIAWVDSDADGIFDLGDGEAGYFPVKTIGGTDYVVSIGYILEDYAYNYYDGSTNHIIQITAAESEGFNFTID